ncbi:MAG: FAD-binding oxidoreductase, partial [Bacteriovoracaceae bacterium]
FKNAPFPRLEKQTDLMIGTEGQLGVIVEAEIKTSKNPEAIVLALSLKSWTENFDELIKLIALMRNNRALIQFCEFIDKDSLSFVDDSRLEDHKDYLFLKVLENDIETAQKILDEREGISILTEGQFNSLRVEVPRKVNETLSRKNLTKKGTDIQVTLNDLDKLLVFYQNLKKKFPDSYLFGHAGDCHFHFNIVADDQKRVDLAFDELYKKIKALHCSPFAEHGIGVLKKKYLRDFLSKEHLEIFSYLKKLYDPHNQFFPDGYMSLPLEKEKS